MSVWFYDALTGFTIVLSVYITTQRKTVLAYHLNTDDNESFKIVYNTSFSKHAEGISKPIAFRNYILFYTSYPTMHYILFNFRNGTIGEKIMIPRVKECSRSIQVILPPLIEMDKIFIRCQSQRENKQVIGNLYDISKSEKGPIKLYLRFQLQTTIFSVPAFTIDGELLIFGLGRHGPILIRYRLINGKYHARSEPILAARGRLTCLWNHQEQIFLVLVFHKHKLHLLRVVGYGIKCHSNTKSKPYFIFGDFKLNESLMYGKSRMFLGSSCDIMNVITYRAPSPLKGYLKHVDVFVGRKVYS
jgi:hypothetical protein